MANTNIKRLITEEGIVLSKEFKPASESWEKDGKIIPAQPDRYKVKVASGEKITEDGIKNVNIDEYSVPANIFKDFKYQSKVLVEFEFSTYGCKPISVTLIK